MVEFRKKTVRDIDLAGKTVLMRVDYNVPMDGKKITNDARIRASIPTIDYVFGQGAKKLILISHLGRPEGKYAPEFSLAPVAERLADLLPDREISFSNFIYGPEAKAVVDGAADGQIVLLENLRFVPEEEGNSEEFAREIVAATGADVFVQDGFAVIHRAHASTDALAHLLPAVAGLLVENEVAHLEAAINNPERPVVVIVGGAKVDDKQPLIEKFLPIADKIIVGGKIASDGYTASDPKIYVAEDFVEDESGARQDIGPKSIETIKEILVDAATIIWNGTLGRIEDERFAVSSETVAKWMGMSDAFTIIGGGDTAGFVEGVLAKNPELKFSLISTGGGASLELLSGKKLPGLEVLQDK